MIIGQEKICQKILNSTLDTFPRTLMLVGAKGSGKHILCNYACECLGLEMIDITDTLSLETIEDIYHKVEPFMYVIRINEISVKEENLILKFLEEPLKNSYIVLIADTEIGILQTILNRCRIWHLQHYTREVLSTFKTVDDDRVLEVAHTPGMVLKLCSHPFGEMIDLSNKILDKIATAQLPNTLSLSNKIAFKDEKDKYDVELFVSVLLNVVAKKWKESVDRRYVDAYILTSELNRHIGISGIDKKVLFEKYLVDLRTLMRGKLL